MPDQPLSSLFTMAISQPWAASSTGWGRGYTCWHCGGFVIEGCTHHCGTAVPFQRDVSGIYSSWPTRPPRIYNPHWRTCPTCNGVGLNPKLKWMLCPKCNGEKKVLAR